MKKKLLFSLLLLVFGLLLVACSDDQEEADDANEQDAATEKAEVIVSDQEKVEEDSVVATVNGEDILGSTYNLIYSQVKTQLHENGQDTEDLELVKKQTLDSIVSQEVLVQDAKAKGIEVSDEEVDTYIEESKAQFESEEQFNQALENLNYTMETYREQARLQLQQEGYMDQEFADIEVSDEDVEAYYEQIASQNDDVPNLDQVRDDIKAQLANMQLRNKLTERVEQLKEKATVEQAI